MNRTRRMPARAGRVLVISMLMVLLVLVVGTACRLPTPQADIPPSPPPLQSTTAAQAQPADPRAALNSQAAPIPPNLTSYLIILNLDIHQGTFSARALIDYTNNESQALPSLFFRLYPNAGSVYGDGWLTVTAVSAAYTAENAPVEPRLTLLDTVMEVPLPQPLAPGEHVQVVIDYNGVAARDFGGERGYGIYNLSDNVLALAGWYPILAVYDQGGWNLDAVLPIGDPVYSDTALYTVDVTAASDVVFATTGVEVSRLQQDNLTTHRFTSGPARDFFLVASTQFHSLEAQEGETTLRSTYLPGSEAAAQEALNTAQQALRVYNARFGPYPYSELDVVQAPMNNASGVEYPGIFLVKSSLYDDPQSLNFLFTVVHEVAHQWWYSTVGNDVFAEPWLDEALATYSSALYFEAARGKEMYTSVVGNWQNTYSSLVSSGRDQPVVSSVDHFVDQDGSGEYGSVVYIKGALALHELRQAIGDPAFFQALQAYYRDHTYGIATTADLLASFEQATAQELDGFYQQWLYAAVPPATETPLPSATPLPTETLTPTPIPTETLVPSETPTYTPLPSPTEPPPPPPPPPESSVSFAVIGDYGMDNQEEADVASLIDSWGVDLIITTGDNNYWVGGYDTIDDTIGRYFHRYIYPYRGEHGEGAGSIRFFPSLGNHDLLTDDGQPYYDYFELPGNERYFDFVWGPVHFFALNSQDSEPNGVGESSEQASWLRNELAASTVPWQVVYDHYPPYSSGIHGSTDWMRWPYQEWGADVLLSGHEHAYERLLINGFPYIVNGLGGAPIYSFENIMDGSQVRFNGDYGAMLVYANAEQMVMQFITRSGEVIDYFVLER